MASVDGATADLDPAALAAVTAALQAAVGMNPGELGPGTLEQLGMGNLQGVNLEEVMANVAASLVNLEQQGDPGGAAGPSNGKGGSADDRANRPKSAFRGVCWNKKNRRWQAAINAGGLYIYLGSFMQEVEAARTFDRANLFLRGNRGKLNYSYSDYVDAEGHLIQDPKLFAHIQYMLSKGKGKRGRPGPEQTGAVPADITQVPGGLQVSQHIQPLSNVQSNTRGRHSSHQHASSSHAAQQVHQANAAAQADKQPPPYFPYNGAGKNTDGSIDLPHGCAPVGYITAEDECFAVLYGGPAVPPGNVGIAVWDGTGCVDVGVFDTEKDARQAANVMLKVAMFQQHLMRSAAEMQMAIQAQLQDGLNGVDDGDRIDPSMLNADDGSLAAVAAAVAAASAQPQQPNASAGAAGNGMPASSAAGGVDMSAVLAAVQQQAAQGMPEIKAENLTEVMSWMQQAMNAGNPSASAVHQAISVAEGAAAAAEGDAAGIMGSLANLTPEQLAAVAAGQWQLAGPMPGMEADGRPAKRPRASES